MIIFVFVFISFFLSFLSFKFFPKLGGTLLPRKCFALCSQRAYDHSFFSTFFFFLFFMAYPQNFYIDLSRPAEKTNLTTPMS